MKDMTLKDILVQQVSPTTSLSIYKGGIWQFMSPTNQTRVDETQSFFLISFPFGLIRQGISDPKAWAIKGAPGDYVALDMTGAYSLVTKAEYARLFPPPNLNPPTQPNNSNQIKEKNFLTNILKGSGATVSNSKTSKPTPPNSGY